MSLAVHLASLGALLPALLVAPTHPLVGTWAITLPVGATIENGIPTPIMATGSLEVIEQGDSLVATLTVPPPAGAPARPPSRMAAKLAPGRTVFVQHRTATVTINGQSSEKQLTSTFTIDVTGDAFAGTVVRVIQGDEELDSAPQPISGKRVAAK